LFVITAPGPCPAPLTTAYAPPPAHATTSTAAITIAAMIPPEAAPAIKTTGAVPTPQLTPLNPSAQTQINVTLPLVDDLFVHFPFPLQSSGQGGGM